MSTEYSTLSDTIHRSRSAKLRPPALRRARVLLVSVSLATVWGCSDATMNPAAEPVEATAPEERLSEVARAIASAMNSADVRLDVLKAMRASPRVNHNLILGDYLREPRAEELLNRSAGALGVTEHEFVALIRGLGELEFLVPRTTHRLAWTGSSKVAVAAQWNSDVVNAVVYTPSGERLEILQEGDGKSLQWYDAVLMVRPRETDGTRIGRQPDIPGPVIQDSGDGQQAAVLRWRVATGEEVAFDVGQFGSPAEFRAAVVETMETRGVWGLGMGALAVEAGDDCDPLAVCPGGGGRGGGTGPWGEPSTFIDRVVLTKWLDHDDIGDDDMELRLEMWFLNGGKKFKGPRWERYRVKLNVALVPDTTGGDFDPLDWMLHYESRIAGGLTAWVHAVEMDPLWALNLDDDLGTQEIAVRDNGQIKHFQHEGEDAMELTLVWEVEEEDDDDETQGHGESG